LTSVTYWTMVFGNNTANLQEAQAKISLPPNSAVSRVTLWVNGKPQEAAFNSTERVTQAYQWITERHRDPLLITEPSRGVINLQAYPVPKYGEMKVRIGITSGLDPRSKRDFSFIAPHIISSNFGIADAKTFVKLESNAPITSNASQSKVRMVDGKPVYTGQIEPGGAHSYQFVAHRDSDFNKFSARATHSKEDMIIEEKLVKSSDSIKRLAIVVDASAVVASKRDEIAKALASIPESVSTKVFIADHRDDVESLAVNEAIARLKNVEFCGGVDDVRALAAARKFIGRDTHAAIVWVHGAQAIFPADQKFLQELLASGEHRLKINELQLDDQDNAVKTQLATWSREASPLFISIEQGGSVAEDLTNFFNGATVSGSTYEVVRNKVDNRHAAATSYDFPVASRLSTVWAADEARRCAELGQIDTAVTLGTAYRVVTPATGAVVMELESDYAYQDLQRNFYSVVSNKEKAPRAGSGGSDFSDTSFVTDRRMPSAAPRAEFMRASAAPQMESRPAARLEDSFDDSRPAPEQKAATDGAMSAPQLQGAINGTIGPRPDASAAEGAEGVPGADATVITGVNTAGTVRVNNLANLEVALNLFTCALQAVCAIAGLVNLIQGFFLPGTRSSACKKLLVGSVLLLAAVAIPSMVDWLLGVQRDTNMFS
jgi:Vault protein inter-alpha-trypsin domain